jgi:hypothetical protein
VRERISDAFKIKKSLIGLIFGPKRVKMHCLVVLNFDQPTRRLVCAENVSSSSENLHMTQPILALS